MQKPIRRLMRKRGSLVYPQGVAELVQPRKQKTKKRK